MIRKIILILAPTSFLAVLIIIALFLVAIQSLGVGSKPKALSKENHFLYVLDNGAGYPSDCWCVYRNKILFQPTIWVIDTNSWKVVRQIKSTESEFDSRKVWILEEQGKRYVHAYQGERYESHWKIIEKATNVQGPPALGLSGGPFHTFDTGDELLIFPESQPYFLGEIKMDVELAAVEKKTYQIRKVVLSKDPFQKYNVEFDSGLDGNIWADESNIVYVSSRAAYGDKSGVLFAFDSQNGQQKAALELDVSINNVIRPVVFIGNFLTLGLFFGIIVVPVLLFLWGSAIFIYFKRSQPNLS